jgi:HSP20 family protein
MPEKSAIAVQPALSRPLVKETKTEPLLERMDRLYNTIAQRAFELFERDGKVEGRHLDHWLEAERELLHAVHVRVEETATEILVQAEVPGFTASDIEVNVEPTRLTITGKRESKEEKKKGDAVFMEACSDEIFRSVQLPSEVNTGKVTATLKNGILEVQLPKVEAKKPVPVEAKTA